jgi:hypothetical protein
MRAAVPILAPDVTRGDDTTRITSRLLTQEDPLGKNQNTFEKRRREMEKRQRAEEKRKRRQKNKEMGGRPEQKPVQEDPPAIE